MRALLILIFPLFLVAEVHYAKVEPFKVYTIRSVVSGKVILSRDDLEGEIVNGEIIAIDDKVDKKDLVITKENISILKKQIEINQQLLPALKENLSRKRAYFNRVDSSSSFSKNQKDMAFASFLAAKRDFLSIKEKILTLKSQLNSLRDKETLLKDKISNKHITIKNRYLYKIYVKKGEFVLTNSLLAKVMDISKAKLTIFLSKDELKDISKKKIFINGKETKLKFYKIWKVADEKFISDYRAEIILKPVYKFSTLVKVEIK